MAALATTSLTLIQSCKSRFSKIFLILSLIIFLHFSGVAMDANRTEPIKKALIIYYADNDGDGYGDPNNTIEAETQPSGYVTNDDDCNDNNAAINPAASELCDALNEDEDCDGLSDNDDYLPVGQQVFYRDADNDSYGNANEITNACDMPAGFINNDDDCNDTLANINPGMPEICDALNLDEDCDGLSDNQDYLPLGQLVFYRDFDNDSYGNANEFTNACDLPSGFVVNNGDCNDTISSINPGVQEQCDENNIDENCNGVSDNQDYLPLGQLVWYRDQDDDGYGNDFEITNACDKPFGFTVQGGDCDDENAAANPDQTEICNDIDDDCDVLVDEGLENFYYQDLDGDGYGTTALVVEDCQMPPGFASNKDDCDDGNANINPLASETCNEVDDDCDELIDEDVQNIYYIDNDGDFWGSDAVIALACNLPVGFASNKDDCDDNNSQINPGGIEQCNEVDDNCDQNIDEGIELVYYLDADQDFWGDPNSSIIGGCSAPVGYVSNNGDCDDNSDLINPAGTESCNGVDDNCDLSIDEGVLLTFYQDNDLDGYGSNVVILACSGGPGKSANQNDCNDNNAAIKPGATEVCNSIDDDCDGNIDEGVLLSFFLDNDLDGYGSNTIIYACSAGPGKVYNQNDCNDNNAAVKPGATEVCNGIDDDCDNKIDEYLTKKYYEDADGDNFGDASSWIYACTAPPGYVTNKNDNCPDDYNPNQYDIDDDNDGDVCDDELDFCDAIDELIDDIEDADLSNNLENSLINKLEQALDKFEDGKYNQAISKLNSFINQVNSKKGNGIPVTLADYWMYAANLMIVHINASTADCDGGGGCRIVASDEEKGVVKSVSKIYPNPTNDFINIESDEVITNLVITQINGAKALYALDVREDESTKAIIDLSELGLNTGIYMIAVHSIGGVKYFNFTFNR